jgi:translation elongation factor EF-Tu-like GTPase
MNELPRIEAEVTFLPASEGGRKEPPTHLSGGAYRPHLVVADSNQSQAITIENEIQEAYLGVAFLSAPEKVEPGESFSAELVLMYWPHPMYESLVSGASFTIREGSQVVGYAWVRNVPARGAA